MNSMLRFLAGAMLLWGVAYVTVSANVPTIYSPYSFLVIIPVLSLHNFIESHVLTLAIGTTLIPVSFLLWSFPLLHGQIRIPIRTRVLTIIMVLLSLAFLIMGWSYGNQYQGLAHTIAMYLLNLICWLVMFILYIINSRQPSYGSNYIFHWVLFAWLAWVAYPWLGELL